MRIIVAGGGTGGHVSPSLAVIEALEEKVKDLELLYLGSKHGIESVLIPKMGIHYEGVSTGKIRRYHKNNLLNLIDPTTIFRNILDILRVFKGIIDSINKIKSFDPEVIFLKGGYVSVPVGIAAKILNIPYVLHESDIVPGLANKILGKYAQTVCVSFPEEHFRGQFNTKILYTGNPIRKEILKGDREVAVTQFKLKKNIPVIMVIGGSQGAAKLNELIVGGLEDLLFKYQIIHITGERDFDWIDFKAKKLAKELKDKYHYFDFLTSNLKDAFKVSDLIISRAGSNVLTEIAANKKPSILVPLSTSTKNHQYLNALVFSRDGASYVMNETEITSNELSRQIEHILNNEEDMKMMSEKVENFYKGDASEKIAEEIIKSKKVLREKKDDTKKSSKKK